MSWIVSLILDWLWAKLAALAAGIVARAKAREEIQKEAEKSVEELEKAETADEIDKSTDSALSGL